VPDDLLGKKVSCNHCAAIFWIQARPPQAPVNIQAQAPLAPVQVVPRGRWPRRWLVAGVCAMPLVVAALVLAFVWSLIRRKLCHDLQTLVAMTNETNSGGATLRRAAQSGAAVWQVTAAVACDLRNTDIASTQRLAKPPSGSAT
jgi:hypothetical protein